MLQRILLAFLPRLLSSSDSFSIEDGRPSCVIYLWIIHHRYPSLFRNIGTSFQNTQTEAYTVWPNKSYTNFPAVWFRLPRLGPVWMLKSFPTFRYDLHLSPSGLMILGVIFGSSYRFAETSENPETFDMAEYRSQTLSSSSENQRTRIFHLFRVLNTWSLTLREAKLCLCFTMYPRREAVTLCLMKHHIIRMYGRVEL
jgi:hypothetical protein